MLDLLVKLFGKAYVNRMIGTGTNIVKPIKLDKNSPFKLYSDSAFNDPKVLNFIEEKLMEYGPYALSNRNSTEIKNFEMNARRALNARNKKTGTTEDLSDLMKMTDDDLNALAKEGNNLKAKRILTGGDRERLNYIDNILEKAQKLPETGKGLTEDIKAAGGKPEADIVDISTQQKVDDTGIMKLKTELGLPEGVEPGSVADKAIRESVQYKMDQQGVKKVLDKDYVPPKTTSIDEDEFVPTTKMSEQGAKAYSANIESYRRPIIRQMLLKDTRINLSDDVRKSLENRADLQRGADPKMDPLRLLNEYYDVNFNKLDELEDIRFTARDEFEAADEFLKKGGLEPKKPVVRESLDDEAVELEETKDLGEKLEDYPGDPDDLAEGGRPGFKFGTGKGIMKLKDLINKKFGKGTVTTAENMELSPKVLQKKMFEDFNQRNTKLSYADKDKRIIPEGLTEEDIDLAILKGEFERKYSKLIPEDLMKTIMADEDPQRVKEVIGHVEQAAIMTDKGMSADQVIDAFKAGEKRKDNAEGGLNYLMGL